MAEIEITILDRPYKIACRDGDEQKVRNFAKDLNEQMTDLQSKLPNVSDINLFVINSLVAMDKLNEAQNKPAPAESSEIDDMATGEFEKIANKLETLAKKIKTI